MLLGLMVEGETADQVVGLVVETFGERARLTGVLQITTVQETAVVDMEVLVDMLEGMVQASLVPGTDFLLFISLHHLRYRCEYTHLQDDFSPLVLMVFNSLLFQAVILYYFTVLIIVRDMGLCMWSSWHINKDCVMLVGIGDLLTY